MLIYKSGSLPFANGKNLKSWRYGCTQNYQNLCSYILVPLNHVLWFFRTYVCMYVKKQIKNYSTFYFYFLKFCSNNQQKKCTFYIVQILYSIYRASFEWKFYKFKFKIILYHWMLLQNQNYIISTISWTTYVMTNKQKWLNPFTMKTLSLEITSYLSIYIICKKKI